LLALRPYVFLADNASFSSSEAAAAATGDRVIFHLAMLRMRLFANRAFRIAMLLLLLRSVKKVTLPILSPAQRFWASHFFPPIARKTSNGLFPISRIAR
jgi:hypothetical protein